MVLLCIAVFKFMQSCIGQETTANMLCFSLILIHQHPKVLKRLENVYNKKLPILLLVIMIARSMSLRLREEVTSVLRDKQEISAEDLDRLCYMEQVRNNSNLILHSICKFES